MNDARLKVQVGAPLRVGHRGRLASPQPAARSPQPAARSPRSNAARLLCHKHCCALLAAATGKGSAVLCPSPHRTLRPHGSLDKHWQPSVVGCAVAWHTAALECTPLNRTASHRCACCAWAADASASHTHSHAHARATAHARTHAHLNLCAGAVHRRAARLQGRLPARRQRRAAVPSGGGPRAALLALDAQACDPATR
jgi:hypothetical protein